MLHFVFVFQRQELQKFQKLMRQRRPQSKFSLQYDKLIIDNEIYMFNDLTGKVEEVTFNRSLSPAMAMVQAYEHSMVNAGPGAPPPTSASGYRKRSSGRRSNGNKLQKSYSTGTFCLEFSNQLFVYNFHYLQNHL